MWKQNRKTNIYLYIDMYIFDLWAQNLSWNSPLTWNKCVFCAQPVWVWFVPDKSGDWFGDQARAGGAYWPAVAASLLAWLTVALLSTREKLCQRSTIRNLFPLWSEVFLLLSGWICSLVLSSDLSLLYVSVSGPALTTFWLVILFWRSWKNWCRCLMRRVSDNRVFCWQLK